MAKNSKLFDDLFVVTDKEKYKKISEKYGATVPSLRPKNTAGKYSPDIEDVQHVAQWVLAHRLVKNYKAEAENINLSHL